MKIEPAFLAYPLVTIESISEKVFTHLANKFYLCTTLQLIGNGAALFMDETRNLMAESELLRFVDVQKIGDYSRVHAKFLKED